MPKYISSLGLELIQRQIANQRRRFERIQQEAGEAAGPSYDWHDNFGYEDARRRSEMESRRLQDLLEAARGAIVFDPPEQSSSIRIGNTALVEDNDSGEVQEFTIGGFGEVDHAQNLVSYESPVGAALLGKTVGEVGKLELDGSLNRSLIVVSIHPPSYRYTALLTRLLEAEGTNYDSSNRSTDSD